jgi:surface carbohydrate biosynthesis protein
MLPKKPFILIPVENQIRELDAKLLLACIAANRGFSSVIGSKREIETQISSFARGVYLAKSLQHGHRKFFRVARQLGHEIVAWDEDALVHLPAEVYYSRRLSPASLECVSHLFAWGEDNAALWRQYPEMPAGVPIHVTGNPRIDLLRDEIQPFYLNKVQKIREKYGNFILINTNFNHVNAFSPIRRLFLPVERPGEEPKFGRAARGMTREYAEGLRDHKQAIFENFKKMIPALENAFPDYTIVVRPHQLESEDIYLQIAKGCQRVRVTNNGNVVPWLMACKALILNGCTTSVEAYAIGVPSISYRAVVNDDYDYGFYRLPNKLSYQCFDFEELRQNLGEILAGKRGVLDNDESKAVIDLHLAAMDGPLACERIVDALEKVLADMMASPKPPFNDRLTGWYKVTKRRVRRQSKSRRAGSHKSMEHHQKKNPEISIQDLCDRIARFQQLLGEDRKLRVKQIHAKLFRIKP